MLPLCLIVWGRKKQAPQTLFYLLLLQQRPGGFEVEVAKAENPQGRKR